MVRVANRISGWGPDLSVVCVYVCNYHVGGCLLSRRTHAGTTMPIDATVTNIDTREEAESTWRCDLFASL